MSEKPTKKKGKLPQQCAKKALQVEQALITTQQAYPEDSPWQIANKVHEMGVVSAPETAYKRLTRSQELQLNRAEIRQHWRDTINYELTPLAVKRTKHALKDKQLSDKDAFSYVKLVIDKTVSDDVTPVSPSMVNVQSMQVYLQQVLGK